MSATVFVYEFEGEEPSIVLRGDTLSDALALQYSEFPRGATLFRGCAIVEDQRVLFLTDKEREEMAFATGDFTLIFTPYDPVSIILVVGGLALGALAISLLTPKIPNIGNQGQADSSNNSLTERENQQRLGGLVPEIFGTVRATPDLIQLPYSIYQKVDSASADDTAREVEYSAMCLGRGRYSVDTNEIYDDTTRIKGIDGTLVEIYNVNQSPNNPFDTKRYTTSSDKYDDVPWNVKKSNSINGQTLVVPASAVIWTDTFIIENKNINNIILNFVCSQGIYISGHADQVANVTVKVGIKPVNADGTLYTDADSPTRPYSEQFIETTLTGKTYDRSEKKKTIRTSIYQAWWKQGTVGAPVANSQTEIARGNATTAGAILAVRAENVDPSTVLWITRIRNNDITTPTPASTDRGDQVIVATNDGTRTQTWGRNFDSITASPAGQIAETYDYKYERPTWVTIYKEALNSDGTTTGIIDTTSNQKIHILIDFRKFSSSKQPVEYLTSDATRRDYLSFRKNIFYGGGFDRIAVRITRTTAKVTDPEHIDEVKIKDIYALSPMTNEDYGNVTTVFSRTYATEGALSLKKRKLNMITTREIRGYNKNGEFVTATGTTYVGSSPPYLATNRIDHIIVNILKDTLLGNIPYFYIDYYNLYTLTEGISTYFASDDLSVTGTGYILKTTATGFNYTYDKTDMSLEEMLKIACSVNHMTAYRELSKFKFLFEGSNIAPIILFNHRNKVPNSQTRTVFFGSQATYDGVEVNWSNPETSDSLDTFKVPYDGSATNPLKIDLVGIRNKRQAFRHAYRGYYSIYGKNVVDEFDALPEAQLLVRGQRIYSADNTRPAILDGEIESVSGATLTLSQPADLTGIINPYIYLQHSNGTVQSLPITQGANNYKVVYSGSLTTALVTNPDYYSNTVYQIWGEQDVREKSFLVDERTPNGDDGTQRVKCTIFNPMIYIADKMTFWFQPLDQNWMDRTPNERTPIPRKGSYILSDPLGKRGYCYYNDSVGSHLIFDTGEFPALGSTFTIMAWVRMTASGTTRPHFIVPTTNGTSFIFQVYENAVSGVFSLQAIRTNTASAGIPNATTQWNHIAVTFSSTNLMRIYINGAKADEVTSTAMTPTRDVYIAGHPSFTANSLKGYMDGLIISYDTLSSDTIRDFYLFEKNSTAIGKY